MQNLFRKAERKKAKIRLGLSAVSGGGKTYSAILVAKGLAGGDLTKVAIIDTENNSADLYAHLGDYNVLPLAPPFSPERYIEAIRTCESAGMEVIIIDSITHEWDGKGGCLEIVESLGGKYQDWSKVTPRHQAFINAMMQSPAHIITTVRRKQDYEMTKGSDGRLKVEKAGLKEVTREGFEYELTANLELDIKHNASASKDRTGLFADKPQFVPSEETGKKIKEWCESGVEVKAEDIKPTLSKNAFSQAVERIKKGELEVYEKVRLTYSLDEKQQKILKHQYDTQNITEEQFDEWKSSISALNTLEELKKFKTKNSPFVIENTRVATLISARLQELGQNALA